MADGQQKACKACELTAVELHLRPGVTSVTHSDRLQIYVWALSWALRRWRHLLAVLQSSSHKRTCNSALSIHKRHHKRWLYRIIMLVAPVGRITWVGVYTNTHTVQSVDWVKRGYVASLDHWAGKCTQAWITGLDRDVDGAENIIILHHKQALLSTQCRSVGLEDNPRIHAVQIITDSTAKTSIIVHTFRRFKWVWIWAMWLHWRYIIHHALGSARSVQV